MISTGGVSVPEIDEHPLDIVVSRNEPVTLNCKVSGDPEPNVEWYKDGELVTTAREDPHSHKILLPDNGLFFLRALHGKKEKDSGQYWCKASNIAGTVMSRKGNLQVACKLSYARPVTNCAKSCLFTLQRVHTIKTAPLFLHLQIKRT